VKNIKDDFLKGKLGSFLPTTLEKKRIIQSLAKARMAAQKTLYSASPMIHKDE
jgi:hypothetical protein